DQLRGVVNMGREAEESMEKPLHVMICVDGTCPRWLGLAIKEAFVPERDARVDVCLLDGHPVVRNVDVGIIVCGGSEALVRGAIHSFAGARQHAIVVAETSLDIPATHLPAKLGQFIADVVASEHGPLYERLANALLDSTEKDVSCAANFAFCRDVATARLVSRVAARNAVMGVADFIPGAGMPLMTMNQINMGFDIAATHGRGLSLGRVPEVAVIVAAGFVYREAAHLLIRLLPKLGLITRIFVAYGGTLVTGRMLASHFVQGLPMPAAEGGIEVAPEAVEA
ncbi:MAG: hypothetical protein J6S63_00500, partial [Atopobiaceae bacterium]|nr:hypothetical protein [Atopobiaceae bacterium]